MTIKKKCCCRSGGGGGGGGGGCHPAESYRASKEVQELVESSGLVISESLLSNVCGLLELGYHPAAVVGLLREALNNNNNSGGGGGGRTTQADDKTGSVSVHI